MTYEAATYAEVPLAWAATGALLLPLLGLAIARAAGHFDMRSAVRRRLTWRPGTLRCNQLYLLFAILGGLQYVPCFANEGWLVTRFLPHAISYGGTELLGLVIAREFTYTA